MLVKQRRIYSIRHIFCNRIINIWNSLLSDTTDFSSLQRFIKSVNTEYLAQSCKLNFTGVTLPLTTTSFLNVFTYV